MADGIRIRDPIHNFVALTEEEVKLVGTPLLQRLRRVRQLAMAYLVYPGALHTRFDHTVGVCHMAGLMAEQLRLDDHERRLVRLAALLHDVGHGPFSHVSENVLARYAKAESLPANQKKDKIHEVITSHLVRTSESVVHLIGQDACNQIAKVLAKGHGQPVVRSIVSGPLDADKQDYLLRDSYFCGVPYGVFDPHQLHRSFVLIGEDDEKDLAVDPDGVHSLEQFVLAKYYLTTNVYRHRVRLITDQMIVRALVLGIDADGIDELREIYTFDNSSCFFERYAAWDDARLTLEFGPTRKAGTLCADLIDRLNQRRLHKRVFSRRWQDFADAEIAARLLSVSSPGSDRLRGRIEECVAAILGEHLQQTVDKRLVIAHSFNIQSVRTASKNNEASILIAGSTPTPFEDFSALFRSIKEGYADGSIEIYAPVDWETRAERRKVRNLLAVPIAEAIDRLTREELEAERQSQNESK